MAFWRKGRHKKNEVILGIDIGGFDTHLGYTDKSGNCIDTEVIPTYVHQTAEIFFERVHNRAEIIFDSLQDQYTIIGVGVTGSTANYFTRAILHPPNMGWDSAEIRTELAKYYSVPIAVTTHANALAIGEMLYGAAKGMSNFIVVTLGGQLGSSIIVDGELLNGLDAKTGEIGHTLVDENGRECSCGQRGCLVTYISAMGLCTTAQDLLNTSSEHSELRSLKSDQLTSQHVYDAALHEDPVALKAFNATGKILGLTLANIVRKTNIEAIILSGGLTAVGHLLFQPTRESMEEHLFASFKNRIKLLPSGLSDSNRGVLSASAFVWNELMHARVAPPNRLSPCNQGKNNSYRFHSPRTGNS